MFYEGTTYIVLTIVWFWTKNLNDSNWNAVLVLIWARKIELLHLILVLTGFSQNCLWS